MMNIRKLCSFFFVFFLLLTMASPILAETVDFSSETQVFSAEDMDDYANTMAITYLQASQLFDLNKSYFLTQGIPVQYSRTSNTYMYFLFADDLNIGYLTVVYLEGDFHSSFVPASIDGVTYAYTNQSPVSLHCSESACYLYYDSTCEQIYGPINDFTLLARTSFENQSILTLHPLEIPIATTRGSTVEIYLDVPIVANTKNPDGEKDANNNVKWICWAASVASVGGHINQTDDSATDVYYWAKNNLSVSGYSYPVGIPEFIQGALNGKYGLSYKYIYQGLSADTVWNYILNNKPVIIDLYTADKSYGHTVVISGMAYGSSPVYQIMDPNLKSYAYVSVSDTTSKTIVYVASGYTYNVWYVSYYP